MKFCITTSQKNSFVLNNFDYILSHAKKINLPEKNA